MVESRSPVAVQVFDQLGWDETWFSSNFQSFHHLRDLSVSWSCKLERQDQLETVQNRRFRTCVFLGIPSATIFAKLRGMLPSWRSPRSPWPCPKRRLWSTPTTWPTKWFTTWCPKSRSTTARLLELHVLRCLGMVRVWSPGGYSAIFEFKGHHF